MATQQQTKYIVDLAVRKTKEFKEVKELIVAQNIAKADAATIQNANSIAEICNAMTDQQASKLIDALIATKEPARAKQYGQTRVNRTINVLDGIKQTITEWSFK